MPMNFKYNMTGDDGLVASVIYRDNPDGTIAASYTEPSHSDLHEEKMRQVIDSNSITTVFVSDDLKRRMESSRAPNPFMFDDKSLEKGNETRLCANCTYRGSKK